MGQGIAYESRNKTNENGATKMIFTVQQNANKFDVVTDNGKVVDTFATQAEAQAQADHFMAEYERVSSIL